MRENMAANLGRCLPFFAGFLLFPLIGGAQDGAFNLPAAANLLANEIVPQLESAAPSGTTKHRIAVCRFNGQGQSYDITFGNIGPVFQASLADALRFAISESQAVGKYTIPDPSVLKDKIIQGINAGTDPEGLTDETISAARTLLNSYNYQVGIVGRFMIDKLPASGPFTISATVITPTTSFTKTVTIQPDDPNLGGVTPQPNPASGRFKVSVYVKHQPQLNDSLDNAWQLLPLERITKPELKNNFLLKVPTQFKGSRYKIVLENKGTPALGGDYSSPQDKDRIFLAATMIDGVSAFWRQQADPANNTVSYVPDTRSYARIGKRVLTAPNRFINNEPNASNERLQGGVLMDTNGPGHSKHTLLGFQRGLDTANAFVFGEPKNSVGAGLIGSIYEIGLISVYFYPEYPLEGDSGESLAVGAAPAGTEPGPEVPQPVFKVIVNRKGPIPVTIWNIIYRYADDPDCPPSEPISD